MSETSIEPVRIVLYKNAFSNIPIAKEMSFHFFCKKLSHEIVETKTKAKAFSPNVLETQIDKYPHFVREKINRRTGLPEGYYYQNGREEQIVVNTKGRIIRSNHNVRKITMLVFDFDQGDLSGKELVKRFEKFNYVIYTTFSHQKDRPKFRVILPLDAPLKVKDFIEYWKHLQKWCGNRADESCKDPSRIFFLPSCSQMNLPHAEIFSNTEGVNVDPHAIYKKYKSLEVEINANGERKTSRKKNKRTRGDYNTLNAVEWFKSHDSYLGPAGDSPDKHFVKCPWSHEHTDGHQGPTDTVLWNEPNKWPTFKCSHNTCTQNERNISQVMLVWPDVDDFCANSYSARTKKIKVEVLCLGFDDSGSYWYQNSNHQHIVGLKGKEHSELSLYTICPDRDYWFVKYGDDSTGKIDWKVAASDLIENCHKKGYFRPQMIRGTGVWRDDNRVIAHLGKELIVNGKSKGIKDVKTIYTYEATVNHIKYYDIMKDNFSKWYYKVFHALPIPERHEKVFLAGCTVAGLLSGYLKWRPHCWITGDGGSGKSAILKYVIAPIWRPIGGIYTEGETTAAGIRQEVRNNALPVLIDESESNSQQEGARVQTLLRLARSASSDSDAQTLKGTVGGRGMAFTVRSVFLFASISESLQFVQDKERFCVIRCQATRGTTKNWPKLRNRLEEILTREFAYRLFSRCIALAPIISRNTQILSEVILDRIEWANARWADQIAHLVCCALSLSETNILDEESLWDVFLRVGDDPDWYNALRPDKEDSDTAYHAIQNLLAYIVITHNNRRLSISEIIEKVVHDSNDIWGKPGHKETTEYHKDLERHGLKVDKDLLLISQTHPQTRRIFMENGFTGHAGILSFFKNAKKVSKVRFNSVYTKAMSIPLEDLKG